MNRIAGLLLVATTLVASPAYAQTTLDTFVDEYNTLIKDIPSLTKEQFDVRVKSLRAVADRLLASERAKLTELQRAAATRPGAACETVDTKSRLFSSLNNASNQSAAQQLKMWTDGLEVWINGFLNPADPDIVRKLQQGRPNLDLLTALREHPLVSVPDQVVPGERFSVTVARDVATQPIVTIVPKDTPNNQYNPRNSFTASRKGTQSLNVPLDAGEYEVRVLQNGTIVERHTITVPELGDLIKAPATVDRGGNLVVEMLQYPQGGGTIYIVPANDPKKAFVQQALGARGAKLSIPATFPPGDYLALVHAGGKERQRVAFTVTDPGPAISAGDNLSEGQPITVQLQRDLTGTGTKLWVVSAADKKHAYTSKTLTGNEKSVELPGPDKPGNYVILVQQGNHIIQEVPFSVTAATGSVLATPPAQAKAGSAVNVTVNRTAGGQNPVVWIVRKGTNVYFSKADITGAGTVSLRAPGEPGDYEIQVFSTSAGVRESYPFKVVE